ncbi:hypothetical protein P692DRAFT_20757559, partial [Suillus brevipes Sb2]
IKVSKLKLNGRKWLLVVKSLLMQGMNIYTYYCMVLERRIIAWLEPVDDYILFQGCIAVWHWNYKSISIFHVFCYY